MKEFHIKGYTISTDKKKLDPILIHSYLKKSYWAENISFDIVKKSIKKSMCFGVYFHNDQAGFARLVTDNATFAYLADVFILESHRGKGLSKWLMQEIMNHEELQGLRGWMLATKDAHGLYEKFGFTELKTPERIMQYKPLEKY
ncbi:MAG: GNAT family N-acetyltransferase [Ignavibacteria bacterium]|jgi:GNAT superfamily N-acetyltransferase